MTTGHDIYFHARAQVHALLQVHHMRTHVHVLSAGGGEPAPAAPVSPYVAISLCTY